MKGWFRPLHHRWARVLLAAAVVVPATGASHVLPVGAVGCNPPVPCVDNSVTYQGSVDEFPIWSGAVQTLVTSIEGDSSPAGQVGATVAGLVPAPAGDGCVVYNCSSSSPSNNSLVSVWFPHGSWQNQPAGGSYSGAWMKPQYQPDDGSGTIYGFSGAYTNASRNTNDICSVGNSFQVKVDGGTVQALGGPNGYKPDSTTYAPTGQSTTVQVGANVSFDVKAVNINLGVSGQETVAQAWVTWGGYDGNRNATWVATRTNDNSCHGDSYAVTDLSPWEWDNPSGYIHWNIIWSYSYHD